MAAAIVYHPASIDVTLTFKRGPLNFRPYWQARAGSNLASSGAARERVTENVDLLIEFDMPHLVIGDDIETWESFVAWALPGGAFKFYPDASIDYWFNCVMENDEWGPARTARKKYGQAVKWRVLEDSHTPAGPTAVLHRFYGMSS